jgi:hypothetical protein
MKPRIVSQSAQDHFETRAAPAYATFLRLKSRENAIAAAVAFWEMRDHLRGGKDKDAFDQKAFKDCPEFRLIRDIAEASKHSKLHRGDVIVTGISGAGSLGGQSTVISSLGSLTVPPSCTLKIDLNDGSSRSMEESFAAVEKFLRKAST